MSNINLEELAQKIDSFYYDFDTYEYNDSFESREEGITAAYNLLVNNSYNHIIDELQEIIENDEGDEADIRAAQELIELLQEIS